MLWGQGTMLWGGDLCSGAGTSAVGLELVLWCRI